MLKPKTMPDVTYDCGCSLIKNTRIFCKTHEKYAGLAKIMGETLTEKAKNKKSKK